MSDYFVYIGTYTGPKSQGIYVYKFAAATGKLTPLGLAAESTNPAFLAIHPNHRYLYAVNEIANYEGKKSGSVSAFSIDRKTGKLTLLNVVASGDPGPCHLVVDQTGKYLLVANYGVGSVAAFPDSRRRPFGQGHGLSAAHGAQRRPETPGSAARAFHLRFAGQSLRRLRGFRHRSGLRLSLRRHQGNADAQRSAFRRSSSRHRPAPLRVSSQRQVWVCD